MAHQTYNEPNPERLPADQQTIDKATRTDAYLASAPHIQPPLLAPLQPLFNYVDCKEAIQEDLMALFDSFGLRIKIGQALEQQACQIVVDNFDKVNPVDNQKNQEEPIIETPENKQLRYKKEHGMETCHCRIIDFDHHNPTIVFLYNCPYHKKEST